MECPRHQQGTAQEHSTRGLGPQENRGSSPETHNPELRSEVSGKVLEGVRAPRIPPPTPESVPRLSLPRRQAEEKGGGAGSPAGCVSQVPGGPRMHPPPTCLGQRAEPLAAAEPDRSAQMHRLSRVRITLTTSSRPPVTELPHPGWIRTFRAGSLLPEPRSPRCVSFSRTFSGRAGEKPR